MADRTRRAELHDCDPRTRVRTRRWPRVAGVTEVARTSRGRACGNSASPGVGRPPGSDFLADWSQGTCLHGLELPSNETRFLCEILTVIALRRSGQIH